MANIKILVGTVYGNALDVAEMCFDQLMNKGHQVKLLRQPEFDQVFTDDADVLLVCTSTTGQGEIPDSLLMFYCQLQDRQPIRPELRYGLITLGDSSYDTFAEAGKLIDSLFSQLQFQRLGEPLVIDACESLAPREDAQPWIESWERNL